MNDSVIVLVATESHLLHAKALMVNCVRQGNWKGNFALVAVGCDGREFEQRGISVLQVDGGGFVGKLHVFSDYFRKWKRLLYMDCDCLVQGDLNAAFEGLSKKLPAIACDGGQQPEEGSILKGWKYAAENYGKGPGAAAHPELVERLRSRFAHLDQLTFCVDIMFFSPETIPSGTLEDLKALQEEFADLSQGHDQPVIVTLLYDRMVPMTKDFCCWFPFDEPSHRVASRGWRGDEEPVILHYFSWFAPWIVKQDLDPPMGAYFNHRLGRVCHELYAENLAAFSEVFPVLQEGL